MAAGASTEPARPGSGPDTHSAEFRVGAGRVWEALHAHPFIRELAAGTLPPDSFRFYVEQNLQYLVEYARAMAIGAEKADDLATMRMFAADLANILDSEIPENEELLRRTIELGAVDRGGADGMAPANVAYTSFLVATAVTGGPAEIMAAILPCTWSYCDIACRLADAGLVHEHPVYAEWIRFFADPAYVELVEGMRREHDRLVDAAGPASRAGLGELFLTSVRLERQFWDMAYGLEHWPERRGG